MDIDINKDQYSFGDFNNIIALLLGENGCPWDRAQTHESMMECLLEECYEVIDAVKHVDRHAMCEELGDVLLQVVFNAKMSENNNSFDINDVINGISKKMISRHTHIFGLSSASDEAQALDVWEESKKKEKGYESVKHSMELLPKSFPALIRAQKILKKASKAGYEEDNLDSIIDDTIKALTQLKDKDEEEKSAILGEILLKSVNISRYFKINPELALTNAIETYINKFGNFEFASEDN